MSRLMEKRKERRRHDNYTVPQKVEGETLQMPGKMKEAFTEQECQEQWPAPPGHKAPLRTKLNSKRQRLQELVLKCSEYQMQIVFR